MPFPGELSRRDAPEGSLSEKRPGRGSHFDSKKKRRDLGETCTDLGKQPELLRVLSSLTICIKRKRAMASMSHSERLCTRGHRVWNCATLNGSLKVSFFWCGTWRCGLKWPKHAKGCRKKEDERLWRGNKQNKKKVTAVIESSSRHDLIMCVREA